MERNVFADMDFLKPGSLPECMKPEEKRITREEFKAAVSAASDYIANDSKLEGMAKMMIPLTGMTFARQMEDILFCEKEG